MQTLISTKYQIVIPKEVRKEIKVKPGQMINVDVVGNQIVLSKARVKERWNWPEDHLKRLRGIWKSSEEIDKYLQKERSSWE